MRATVAAAGRAPARRMAPSMRRMYQPRRMHAEDPYHHYRPPPPEGISVNTLIASFATLMVGMAGGGVGAAVWVDSKVAYLSGHTHQEIEKLKIQAAALQATVDMIISNSKGHR